MEAIFETYLKLFSAHILRYFIIGGAAFGLFYFILKNYFKSWKIQVKEAKKKDFYMEILHSIQSTAIFALIGTLVLNKPFSGHTLMYFEINEYPLWWIPTSLIIALLIHDTYFYWMHRLMHHPKLYKRTHLVHHKSTNPSPWTSYSFQLIEAIAEGSVLFLIVFILPMHPLTMGLFITMSFLINVYGHLGYELFANRFKNNLIFKFLNTSVYHNMHHSHVQGNYSLYFRHWDRWMKTEHPQYEAYFDKVTQRKLVEKEERLEEKSQGFISGLKKLVPAVLLVLGSFAAKAQIVGKWKMEHRDAIVEIYEKNGLYYCKVIDAGNYFENKIIEKRDVLLFFDFKKTAEGKYVGGKVHDPYKNVTVKGQVVLIADNRLKIYGEAQGQSETVFLRKL